MSPLSRLSIVALALLGAACGDVSPVAPTSQSSGASAAAPTIPTVFSSAGDTATIDMELTCTVDTEAGTSTCTDPNVIHVADGVLADVIFQSTNYFTLVKGTVNCVDGQVGRTCTESNSIKNLMSQPIGATATGTVSGVKVIFKAISAQKNAGGAAAITVTNAATGTFTGLTCTNNTSTVTCPYLTYNQIIQPQATSAAQTWTLDIKAPATTYSYTVVISVPAPVETAVFRWILDQQDLTSTDAFFGVYGRSNTEVYAAGAAGQIRKWNGTAWGTIASPTTVRLNSVWAASATTDIFIAGFSNTMLRSTNGTSFTAMTIPGDPANRPTTWYGVYGFSATDAYAVGTYGMIRKWNGSSWTAMASPVSIPILTAVWGSSSTNMYAVGTAGTILKYDGTSWKTQTSGTTTNLYSVWGNATGTVVYASGRNGVLLRTTDGGANWVQVALPAGYTTQYTWGMWGTGTGSIYIATQGGTVLHFDGTTWRTQATNQTANLFGMWGTSATSMFAVGSGKTLARGTN